MPYIQSWTLRQPIETNTGSLDIAQADCILTLDPNRERSEFALMADAKICTPNPSRRNKDSQSDDLVVRVVCISTTPSAGDRYDVEAQLYSEDGMMLTEDGEVLDDPTPH